MKKLRKEEDFLGFYFEIYKIKNGFRKGRLACSFITNLHFKAHFSYSHSKHNISVGEFKLWENIFADKKVLSTLSSPYYKIIKIIT